MAVLMTPLQRRMRPMSGKIFALIISLGLLVFGIKRFKDVKSKNDAIDSIADAQVIKVLNLGRDSKSGKDSFAVTYKVLIDAPFEVLETPCTVEMEIGDRIPIYYEQANYKTNYYLAHRFKFDPRFKLPVITIIMSALVIVGVIIGMIF